MSETTNFALPLLDGGQAQKHVTVNEALARIDALGQIVIQSSTISLPPVGVPDGQVWSVPAGGVNAWAGQAGRLALASNGGWIFVDPQVGWQAWQVETGDFRTYDGSGWRKRPAAQSESGAATSFLVEEFDHSFQAGGAHSSIGVIPAMSVVLGVTCRVITQETGSLSSWKFGVAGAHDRYGSGLGIAKNTWGRGITGSPVTYYSDTPLLVTPENGDFDGVGAVRFAVHLAFLNVPQPV